MHSTALRGDVLNTRTAFLSHFLLILWIGSDQSHDAFLQQVCIRSVIPLRRLLITLVVRARACVCACARAPACLPAVTLCSCSFAINFSYERTSRKN